jgi:hypothetical protein
MVGFLRAFFLIISVLALNVRAEEFNIFKSYKDAKVKPPQYSRARTQHAVDEYLTVTQKKMMKYRHGPDRPDFMFDKSWSGFNKAQNTNKGETRRNLRGSDELNSSADRYPESVFPFRAALLVAVGLVVAAVTYHRHNTGNKIIAKGSVSENDEEHEGQFMEA